MRTVNYTDGKISNVTIGVSVLSMVVAVGILTYPRLLASKTEAADGWVTLLTAGILSIMITWVIANIASKFPNQSFLDYASFLLSRPVAIAISVLYIIVCWFIVGYELAFIADISQHYLFDRTPTEVVVLAFLLVIVYAVSGSRNAMFRMCFGFMAFSIIATIVLVFMSLPFGDFDHLLPVFTTDWKTYIKELPNGILSYTGGFILLFYMKLNRDPKKGPKSAAIGVSVVVILYVSIYLACIAVLGNVTTANTIYPLVELANTIHSAGFLDRIESLYYVIWITTIFLTCILAYDVSVMIITDLFPKANKKYITFGICPIIFSLSILPANYYQLGLYASIVGYSSIILTVLTIMTLNMMYFFKRKKKQEIKQ
ncbi:spore germination protein [Oceanobacillus iheyensis HTE831]|uniref:Spore germination protein n=1 Tax=Oceanobacillus iheyensis (strain DSM 14371 / CIP 107618 / JCM 11309 / KCTC 3954 / HTE831) TaxID=221109 RepID=Q8ESE4_OCEIH|nr:endospore germination permease [Oceanobacillus iheyensis]BAC12651.1 spore germination protein [Oceanobacillus iheyensis HTE831]